MKDEFIKCSIVTAAMTSTVNLALFAALFLKFPQICSPQIVYQPLTPDQLQELKGE